MESVKREDINIAIDQEAILQLKLMKEHDYTLENKVFRLKIDGKGCDGFTYELGWSDKDAEDITINLANDIMLHLDPFTAFYCAQGKISYHFDPTGDEGLTFTNLKQEEHHGKFFKDESKVPEFLKK